MQGSSAGSVVKKPAYQWKRKDLIPGQGRSYLRWSNQACMPQLLNLCSRAGEPQQEMPPQREAGAPQTESSPCLLQ